MLNAIRFFYNLNDIYISKINGTNFVRSNNKLYIFVEIFKQDEVYEAYLLTNKYPEYDKFVLNKNNSIFTPFNNGIYVLIEKIQKNYPFPAIKTVPIETNYLLDRTPWGKLWSLKIDNYEYQMRHIRGKYKSVDESMPYFIGMCESAISYINYNVESIPAEKVICRRRMCPKEYYNPLNIVVDNRMRDISEHLKYLFWYGNYNYVSIEKILANVSKNKTNYQLLYARLLYPSFYFDIYEEVINNRCSQDAIIRMINRVDEYEKYINDIYNILLKYEPNLIKVDWL